MTIFNLKGGFAIGLGIGGAISTPLGKYIMQYYPTQTFYVKNDVIKFCRRFGIRSG